jgi:hypothetical protein
MGLPRIPTITGKHPEMFSQRYYASVVQEVILPNLCATLAEEEMHIG